MIEPPVELVIGLGANLGADAAIVARFDDVARALAARGAVRASRVYRSAALTPGDPPFLNAALAVRLAAPWAPLEALAALQALEARHGRDRDREGRWGPRPLDLDVLLWGAQVLALPRLTVPHPRLHERAFALVPALELVGDVALPGRADSLGTLAAVAGPVLEPTGYVIAGGVAG